MMELVKKSVGKQVKNSDGETATIMGCASKIKNHHEELIVHLIENGQFKEVPFNEFMTSYTGWAVEN